VIEITSLNDSRVSDYSRVGDPQWLLEQGLFVAEGRLVVRRLFEAGTFAVCSVLITPAAQTALADILETARCPIYLCEQALMNQVAGFNFHRGCLALGKRPTPIDPASLFQSTHILLALEGVGNPDNVGGLFRVAAAFGVEGILLDRTSGDPLYRKAIRTSMGAAFRVPFAKTDNWLDALTVARAAGSEIAALTPEVSATNLADYVRGLSSDRGLIVTLGAEGPGLSRDALSVATTMVRIPIAREVDSLNVVVAAGIALAAVMNRSARDSSI
jgi:tRNA G18 (ribose-2'-O)-methylase SpoU